MIEIKLNQQDIIQQLINNCKHYEISDFVLELTRNFDEYYNKSLILRLSKRESIRNG